ncbi:cytochrome P450 [Daedaleopsis nitida]|nr:cytochrome P450 [Daedaleopsis nitida]
MNSSLLQGIATCVVSWIMWKYFRQIIIKSSLDNIPGPASPSFLYGNIPQFLNRDGWGFIRHLIETYPGIAKLNGPLGHRILFVFDPMAIHNIIVKDQHIFEETAWFIKSMLLELGPGLLATLGERHRKQRKMLNPVFSIAHMRQIIPIFNAVVNRLTTAIESRVNNNVDAVELDIIVWMGRAALELIGQAGLGYSFDPLTSDAPDAFGTAIKAFQAGQAKTSLLRRLLPYIPDVGSPWFRGKVLDLIPHEGIRQVKSITSIMHARSTEIYEDKKHALVQGDEAVMRQVGEGKDIMSILLRENMSASQEDRLPEEELIGQMSTFILAAMDTTSNAIAVTLQLLADHPEVQERLRREILEASSGQDLDYDELVSLPYLDAVCRETLRLHAPIANVFRETRADVVLPLSQPIKGIDGSMINEIPIPKDTTVVVGLLASNCNKAIWGEDAMEWKPERWLSPLPESVTAAKIPGIYSNLMTFLGGGRSCIGFKFSQLEMKVVLCKLLGKFTFSPSGKPVVWNLSAIRFPTVGSETRPSLPMKVGLYKHVDPQ